MAKNGIFVVDTQGLRRQARQRGLPSLLKELIQNFLDTKARNGSVEITPTDVRGQFLIVVTDDDPDGFADLRQSFTMFAESEKRDDADKRGFMNIGEKYVVAACLWAQIVSTKGGVYFDVDREERRDLKERRATGTEFRGVIRTNKDEVDETLAEARRVIVPEGVAFTVNGAAVPQRTPVAVAQGSLETLLPDENRVMVRRRRSPKHGIKIYRPLAGEKPTLYELGLPVVEFSRGTDSWHVDVGQRAPVSESRDNVPVPYLREVRAIVLTATANLIDQVDAGKLWTRDAIGSGKVEPEIVLDVLIKRFGTEHIASRNPRDPEANAAFIAKYPEGAVLSGGSLSKGEWDFVNEHELVKPTSFYTPAPGHGEGATKATDVDPSKWTAGMVRVADLATWMAQEMFGIKITVTMILAPGASMLADYSSAQHQMRFNVSNASYAWFDRPLDGSDADNTHGVLATIIHELAHQIEGNHLSDRFTHACTDLGARAVRLAVQYPERFEANSKVAVAALSV